MYGHAYRYITPVMIESGRETLSSSEGHTTAPVGSVGWVVMVQVINNSHIKELKNWLNIALLLFLVR